MLINKDRDNDHSVQVAFADPLAKRDRHFSGDVDRVVFGPAEYVWHADPAPPGAAPGSGRGGGRGGSGHASPDGPPSKSSVAGARPDTLFQLPKASIIVLRGKLAE
jgi:hypothetical protein